MQKTNILPLLSLFMLYITVSTSYIKGLSILRLCPPLRTLQLHTAKDLRKIPRLTRMAMTEGDLNNLNIVQYGNANLSYNMNEPGVKNKEALQNIPNYVGGEINISFIYINIEKVHGVYFSKGVNNVIFTFPDKLSELFYYEATDYDMKGNIYKISNNTQINMKGLKKFAIQSFNNNNIDGIIF